MTIAVVVLALICLASVAGIVLAWHLKKDLERQHANVRALESRAASVEQADRLRMQGAMDEDRSLVQKLLVAIREAPPGPAPRG